MIKNKIGELELVSGSQTCVPHTHVLHVEKFLSTVLQHCKVAEL